jgi:hypothetical protein
MCIYDGCNNWTGYNFEGLKAQYCSVHKKEGMVNVKDKTCIHEGCRKRPTFNTEGEANALYCATHKKEGMVDVKNKTCIHEGCRKIPIFNTEGEANALYCATHKKEGMVNVKSKTCIHEGCRKIPIFNTEGEANALYCATHKKEGMVDVKHKTCIHEGCRKQPTFNTEGEANALYCATHKKEGMVNVKSKTCIHEGCRKIPTFNTEGEANALYCATHKKEGMVDVKSKTCYHNWCSIRATDKYDGYCLRCYIYTFPDKPVARNYKTKERAVVEFVCERFPEHTWITDKKINDGCSMRRPDILVDLGYQVLIIEIDENAHQDYDCSCENKRIMELSQDVGHRPIVFIRFNPDSYIKDDKKIPSCWDNNINGICVVKYKDDWEYRLSILEEQIKYWTSSCNSTTITLEIIQLFYDT